MSKSMPEEDAWGNEIKYVWVVYRPAVNSRTGEEEILMAFDNLDGAERHSKIASGACGETKIQQLRLSNGKHPLSGRDGDE